LSSANTRLMPRAFSSSSSASIRQYADPMQIVLLVAGIVSLYPLKELETGLALIF
jgi:hypothetical protein